MANTISILPVSLLGKTGVTLNILAVNYKLNSTSVQLYFQILDSTSNIICSGDRTITNITDWGTDDSVLVGKLITALGLTQA